jgi:hypothetical protein
LIFQEGLTDSLSAKPVLCPDRSCPQLFAAVATPLKNRRIFSLLCTLASASIRPNVGKCVGGTNGGQDLGADMAHLVGRLAALKVAKVKKPGMYADGAGLYLQVTGDSEKAISDYCYAASSGRRCSMCALSAIS